MARRREDRRLQAVFAAAFRLAFATFSRKLLRYPRSTLFAEVESSLKLVR
jgi:hypothetical protein